MYLQKDLVLISNANSSTQIFRIDLTNEDETWTVKTKNRLRNFKFCSICGHMLRNQGSILVSHFAAQHKNDG